MQSNSGRRRRRSRRVQDYGLTLVGPSRRAETIVKKATFYGTVALTAGAATGSFGASSLASTNEWTSYLKNLYVEYKIVRVRVHVYPSVTNATSTSNFVNLVGFATDRSGAASSAASMNALVALDDSKIYPMSYTGRPFTYTATAIDLEDQLFSPVASAGSSFSVVYYATGLGTGNFAYFLEIEIQLRGRV